MSDSKYYILHPGTLHKIYGADPELLEQQYFEGFNPVYQTVDDSMFRDSKMQRQPIPEKGGIKHDQDKTQLELLSSVWIQGVGKILTFGAKKYSAHNWRQGIQQSRLLGACLRHIFAFLGGEDNDHETGICHLYHASCCLMFASELLQSHPDLDDRYKGK